MVFFSKNHYHSIVVKISPSFRSNDVNTFWAAIKFLNLRNLHVGTSHKCIETAIWRLQMLQMALMGKQKCVRSHWFQSLILRNLKKMKRNLFSLKMRDITLGSRKDFFQPSSLTFHSNRCFNVHK